MKRLTLLFLLCIAGMTSYAQDIPSLLSRAEQGDAEALFSLYYHYLHGHGVEADSIMACGYLMQAAEKDYVDALYDLGCYYKDGRMGLPKWEEKAMQLLFRAFELGYSDAEDVLDDLTEDYDRQAKRVRRAVYRQTISVAPREQYLKYSENKRRLIRQ